MVRYYANNVPATTLNGAVNDTTTSWTVVDGTGYPAVPFASKCESEIVLVTAKSGTNNVNWTVQRAYDGTTAASHPTAAVVTDAVIADDMDQLWVPGGITWIEDVNLPLTTLTGITTYSGTWSINTYLQLIQASNTQCRAFSNTGLSAYGMNVVEAEIEIPSSGFTTSGHHIGLGIGFTNTTNQLTVRLRGDSNVYFEQDGAVALSVTSWTKPAAGTWVKLRLVSLGSGRHMAFVDGTYHASQQTPTPGAVGGAVAYPYLVSYAGTMTVRFRNLKAWSVNLQLP